MLFSRWSTMTKCTFVLTSDWPLPDSIKLRWQIHRHPLRLRYNHHPCGSHPSCEKIYTITTTRLRIKTTHNRQRKLLWRQKTFTVTNLAFQLVPPLLHLQSAAECAIQTWKAHFIPGLSSYDPTFPLREWNQVIPKCNITLNLLCSSRRQPHLSSYNCLFEHKTSTKRP